MSKSEQISFVIGFASSIGFVCLIKILYQTLLSYFREQFSSKQIQISGNNSEQVQININIKDTNYINREEVIKILQNYLDSGNNNWCSEDIYREIYKMPSLDYYKRQYK